MLYSSFFLIQASRTKNRVGAAHWALLVVISRAQADSACLLRYDFRANVRSQRSHLNCLSGECVCMCARRFERSANALLHSGHKKGLSPVWDLMCPCRSHGRLKAFPHTSHLWRSLWVKTCIARAGIDTYALPQCSQRLASLLSKLLWVCLCRERFDDVAYDLPHSAHTYRLRALLECSAPFWRRSARPTLKSSTQLPFSSKLTSSGSSSSANPFVFSPFSRCFSLVCGRDCETDAFPGSLVAPKKGSEWKKPNRCYPGEYNQQISLCQATAQNETSK